MFKTNGDLYNLSNVPFTYHHAPPALSEKLTFQHDHWLPLGFQSATTSHISFVFHSTNYLRWIENTCVVWRRRASATTGCSCRVGTTSTGSES